MARDGEAQRPECMLLALDDGPQGAQFVSNGLHLSYGVARLDARLCRFFGHLVLSSPVVP